MYSNTVFLKHTCIGRCAEHQESAAGRPPAGCGAHQAPPSSSLCLPADSGRTEDALSNNTQLRRIRYSYRGEEGLNIAALLH
ncbi:hypothetical protein CesoFtcFv8_002575 [Champsocephalus esox]|uniref:Uncharacterized protein n=1 Tax=Champsocephalus esox TaxID=159716 RepID=A0AAN8CYA1_9TELE|nr:hypothetical protein CesoFtcFv8_002575 [Champsocephalus esox]